MELTTAIGNSDWDWARIEIEFRIAACKLGIELREGAAGDATHQCGTLRSAVFDCFCCLSTDKGA